MGKKKVRTLAVEIPLGKQAKALFLASPPRQSAVSPYSQEKACPSRKSVPMMSLERVTGRNEAKLIGFNCAGVLRFVILCESHPRGRSPKKVIVSDVLRRLKVRAPLIAHAVGVCL
jgi:hypothetical protein